MRRRALVLGAGGHAAIAWELGVLAGMADLGVDVRDADVIVGTSAGSIVGVQITSDLTLEELFQRQIEPRLQTKESAPPVDFARWRADFMRAKDATDHDRRTVAIADLARAPPGYRGSRRGKRRAARVRSRERR